MINIDYARWKSVQNECNLHVERLRHAHKRIEHLLPMTVDSERNLSEDDISFFDQLIYRYMKLQDTMGEKLFPMAMKLLGEDFSAKPFVDMLNRLERLCLIPSREEWLVWRELRNDLTHEYPDNMQDRINAINDLPAIINKLTNVLERIVEYVDTN